MADRRAATNGGKTKLRRPACRAVRGPAAGPARRRAVDRAEGRRRPRPLGRRSSGTRPAGDGCGAWASASGCRGPRTRVPPRGRSSCPGPRVRHLQPGAGRGQRGPQRPAPDVPRDPGEDLRPAHEQRRMTHNAPGKGPDLSVAHEDGSESKSPIRLRQFLRRLHRDHLREIRAKMSSVGCAHIEDLASRPSIPRAGPIAPLTDRWLGSVLDNPVSRTSCAKRARSHRRLSK